MDAPCCWRFRWRLETGLRVGGELQLLELHTPACFFSMEPPGWDAAQEKLGWLPFPCPVSRFVSPPLTSPAPFLVFLDPIGGMQAEAV